MATGVKLNGIRPELKAMIDDVIVPILVREYIVKLRERKRVELIAEPVTTYGLANTALAENVSP